MFLKSIRIVSLVFILTLLLISFMCFVTHSHGTREEIDQFFAQSIGCENYEPPCFIGIIPDETEQDVVYDRLYENPFIRDFRMAQVEFGVRQMFWQWNGQQPDFLQGDGAIRLIGEQVRSIEIETRLSLGDIWLTFGASNVITVTPFEVILYYPELSLFMRSAIHCEAFWYSPVTIEMRGASRGFESSHTLETAIAEYCRNH